MECDWLSMIAAFTQKSARQPIIQLPFGGGSGAGRTGGEWGLGCNLTEPTTTLVSGEKSTSSTTRSATRQDDIIRDLK